LNWFKILKISQFSDDPAWIDSKGKIISYIGESHWQSLKKHLLKKDTLNKEDIEYLDDYINKERLVRVYIGDNDIGFEFDTNGIYNAQKKTMIDIMINYSRYNGFLDIMDLQRNYSQKTERFNSFEEFQDIISRY